MARRVAWLVLAMVATAILAFGVPTAFALRSAQRHGLELELKEEAFIAAGSLRPEEAPLVANLAPVQSEDPHRLALYDTDLRRLDGVGPALGDGPVQAARTGLLGEEALPTEQVAAVLIPRAGGQDVILRVAENSSEVSSNLNRQIGQLALAGSGVLALSAVLGVLLAVRLTRPIRALNELAKQLGTTADPPEPPKFGVIELDELARSLIGSTQRVRGALDRERRFSAHVAHQLRTPIAAARVAVETELTDPRSDPAVALREVLVSVERLESTTGQLLALSRGLSETTVTDAARLARDAGQRWGPQFRARGRAVHVDATSAPTRMPVAAIDQILDVLIDNALRHGRGTCRVTATTGDDGPVLTVDDEGTVAGNPFTGPAVNGHRIGLKLAQALAAAESASLTLTRPSPTRFSVTMPSSE